MTMTSTRDNEDTAATKVGRIDRRTPNTLYRRPQATANNFRMPNAQKDVAKLEDVIAKVTKQSEITSLLVSSGTKRGGRVLKKYRGIVEYTMRYS